MSNVEFKVIIYLAGQIVVVIFKEVKTHLECFLRKHSP